MMPALELHAIARYSALRMIDSLAEGLVVAACAALLLRFSRRQNAGTRFAIGFSALLAIAVLPFTSGFWHNSVSSTTLNRAAFVAPESWALYLLAGWAVVAGCLIARVGRGVWHLHKLRESCDPVDVASLEPSVQETFRHKRTWRKIALCTSEQVRVPTAIGLVKPAIVIPRWVMQELSPGELNQIVLHEFAHLRRWDDWTNLAQQVVKALFFFHPAVWWIEKKVTLEREMACDDAVLEETASPRAYAECLAHLAERSFVQRSIALAQAAVGRLSQTSQRVAQILDVNRPKGAVRIWKPAASLIVGTGMLCSVWVSKTPQLIAFQDREPSHQELATSLPDQVSIPATKAALVQQAIPERKKSLEVASRLKRKSAQRSFEARERKVAVRSENAASNMVHLSAWRSVSVPVAETLLVVIDSGQNSSGSQIYHIQMWHMIVLPAPADLAGDKVPSKKT